MSSSYPRLCVPAVVEPVYQVFFILKQCVCGQRSEGCFSGCVCMQRVCSKKKGLVTYAKTSRQKKLTRLHTFFFFFTFKNVKWHAEQRSKHRDPRRDGQERGRYIYGRESERGRRREIGMIYQQILTYETEEEALLYVHRRSSTFWSIRHFYYVMLDHAPPTKSKHDPNPTKARLEKTATIYCGIFKASTTSIARARSKRHE